MSTLSAIEITARLAKLAHIALIAETGGGKSVLAASLLEMLRPYASCLIFDASARAVTTPRLSSILDRGWPCY